MVSHAPIPSRKFSLWLRNGILVFIGLSSAIIQWRVKSLVQPRPYDTGGLRAGTSAPDFDFEDLKGERYSLSQQPHRIVVLDFSATWCLPCQEQLLDLAAFRSKHKDSLGDVVFLIVYIGETPEKVGQHLAGKKIKLDDPSFRAVIDRMGLSSRRYNVLYVPSLFVIDQHHMIREVEVGYNASLERKLLPILEALLKDEPGG